MHPDEYQQAWKAQKSHTRVTVDVDSLLLALRRNQQDMRSAIVLGDFAGIATSLLLLLVTISMGVMIALPWTWYLMVPANIWSIGFTLMVRSRQKRKTSQPAEPLLASVQESLAQLEQEIWLQHNEFWWCQLPTAMTMIAFFVHLGWRDTRGWWETLGPIFGPALMIIVFYGAFYYLNQYVLRTQYEPRRQELLTLLGSLSDESTREVNGNPILLSAVRRKNSRWPLFAVGLCFLTIMLILTASLLVFARSRRTQADPTTTPNIIRSEMQRLRNREPMIDLDFVFSRGSGGRVRPRAVSALGIDVLSDLKP